MLILKSLEKTIKSMGFQTTYIVDEKLEPNKCTKDYRGGCSGMGDSNVHYLEP